jgi:hypothetical protein
LAIFNKFMTYDSLFGGLQTPDDTRGMLVNISNAAEHVHSVPPPGMEWYTAMHLPHGYAAVAPQPQ